MEAVCTDVSAMSLHSEMVKIPWISGERSQESRAKGGAKNLGSPSLAVALADIVQQIKILAQANGLEGESLAVAHPDASGHKLVNGCGLRMAVRRNRSKPEARIRVSLQ
jgi:hypothetical protein